MTSVITQIKNIRISGMMLLCIFLISLIVPSVSALQNSGIDRLTELIGQLMPLIMTIVMIMLVVGVVAGLAGGFGGKGKKGGLLGIFVILLIVGVPVVSAAASVSPGSTTVYDYMPATQRFGGLEIGSINEHQIVSGVDDSVLYANLHADSSGVLIVTVVPYQDGSNPYVLEYTNGTDVLTFTVQNNTIMDYLIPIATILIMVSIITLILGIFRGRR